MNDEPSPVVRFPELQMDFVEQVEETPQGFIE